MEGGCEGGGQGRTRTADAGLFRAALYQLSYLAARFQTQCNKSPAGMHPKRQTAVSGLCGGTSLVRTGRVELPWVAPLDPKSSASASSATSAAGFHPKDSRGRINPQQPERRSQGGKQERDCRTGRTAEKEPAAEPRHPLPERDENHPAQSTRRPADLLIHCGPARTRAPATTPIEGNGTVAAAVQLRGARTPESGIADPAAPASPTAPVAPLQPGRATTRPAPAGA
jgi:hypothetical protein